MEMTNTSVPTQAFGSSSEPPVMLSYVHRLWQLTRLTQDNPTYRVEMEGMPDKPYKTIVRVGSEHFSSSRYFARSVEAKEDAARVVYEVLSARANKYDEFAKAFHLIDQEATPCMVILNDFNKRSSIALSFYYVVEPEGPCGHFIAAVSVGGNTYTGETANTEEQVKENAARTAVKSILATRNEYMLEIFSKTQTGITVQGGLSSEMNIPPVVTASISSVAYTPCSSNEVRQQIPPNVTYHEQIQQQYPPFLPVSFPPHEFMEWDSQLASTTFEMTQRSLPQAMPVGDVSISTPRISETEYQDDSMIVDVDYEEPESLSGKKRKMDPNDGPADKQARTTL